MSWPGVRFVATTFVVCLATGCNSSSTTTQPNSAKTLSEAASAEKPDPNVPVAEADVPKPSKRRSFAPVDIAAPGQESSGGRTMSAAEQLESIRAALKPFQVLLGQWNGLSQKQVSDRPDWAYDWVTDPKQPGLRVRSEKGVYIRDGVLTYLPQTDQFEFRATDSDGTLRTFRGTFTEPVRDVIADEKKPQRTYKLQLTEPEPNASGEQWRVTFNQQENNRYILELDRKRGSGPFGRVDTFHTQREGTSFALSDTDYGDKTCIISQGLGTISVSYKGQSYWVCCSGCKAAFDDDPEKWIAKWEEKKKAMGK